MTPAQARILSYFTIVFGGFAQGASYNIAREAGHAGLPPVAFLFWSIVGATLLLFALAVALRQLPPLTPRTVEYFALSGLLTVASGWVINVLTTPVVGASFVSLTVALIPLLTYSAATALGLDTATLRRSAGVGLALVGGVILAWSRFTAPDAPVFWIALALCMPVLLAAGNIYRTARWPKGLGPVELTFGMVAGSLVWIVLAALVSGQGLGFPQIPGAFLLISAQAAVLGWQFLALLILLKHGGIVFQSLMAITAALFGVILAVTVLGEEVPAVLLPTAVLILAGVLVTGTGKRKE